MPRPARLLALPLLLLPALLAGCPGADDKPGGAGDTGDTAVIGPATPTDITVTVSPAMATVLIVTWHTDAPTRGYVVFGPDESYAHQTPLVDEGTDHRALLLGNVADADVHLRVFSDDGSGAVEVSDPVVARTDPLPRELPSLTRSGAADPYGGFLSLPLLGQAYAATFADTDGNVVWYHLEDRGYVVQRVRLARDGQSVLYNAVWLADLSGAGEIVRVSLDGTEVSSTPAPLTTHDFVELPDGTLCAIYTDARELDGEPVYGDAILEIAPDGTSHTVWSAFDTYDPATEPSLTDSDATWTHFNVVHYDPTDDTYLVGIRNFDSIVKVDRATGAPVWTLGGWQNDFTFEGDGAPTTGQHGFRLDGDALTVFDNGPAETASSRAVRYTLDFDAHTYRQDWEHHHDDPLFIWAMGDVEPRDDGGVRITWSTAGLIEQLDGAGEPAWEIAADFGVVFGYSSWLPDLYSPDAAPL